VSSILLVDDEEAICWSLERLLTDDGHEVRVSSSAEDALESAAHHPPDLIVLDVRLPGLDGLSALSGLKQAAGGPPVIVITAFGDLDTAVTALRHGAFDYLTKPFDLGAIGRVIARALEETGPRRQPQRQPAAGEECLLGRGERMQEVFKRIALVAPTDASILIAGESGTGKELVARAIHRHSRRSEGPWVPVNLASLNPSLLESELFGHVRGAFTGATDSRPGLLELAAGGTVFLDEVADIPLSVQVKLLRVLEQREVAPVGDARPRTVDFRVVAATHRDLRQEVREGRFRADLFFRLAVFEIRTPALRERPEDIPVLARQFLQSFDNVVLAAETLDELARRPWPGNVRELRNAVEHGALVARAGAMLPEHLPPPADVEPRDGNGRGTLTEAVLHWTRQRLAAGGPPGELYEQFLAEAEPPLFATVLEQTHDNRLAAAHLLGIHRATLRKRLKNDDAD